ncbi:GntR family transcriptional regulator [Paenarthrobacter sp. NPDC092416]|uniref:GntR family transcriptional regulator n=1 Tax=Paenarthrobacter sp. NPDC092416 TaxID=3364386 RepID=UPI0037FC5C96
MAEIKVARLSLRDQVLAVLRKRLVTGELQPGSLYSASAISSELGVSTSPVREAMITLVHQGVLEAVRNRGFRVLPMSNQDRRDVHDLRLLVEVPAMERLAGHPALRYREQELRAIVAENIAAAANSDLISYLDSDMRFHLSLLELCGNDRLSALVASLRDQTRRVGLIHLLDDGTLLRTAGEHEVLLESLLAGDGSRVHELTVSHLSHINRDWGPADDSATAQPQTVRVPADPTVTATKKILLTPFAM